MIPKNGGEYYKRYRVTGYDKRTGQRTEIVVGASTTRHAKTMSYSYLTYPKVIERVR